MSLLALCQRLDHACGCESRGIAYSYSLFKMWGRLEICGRLAIGLGLGLRPRSRVSAPARSSL